MESVQDNPPSQLQTVIAYWCHNHVGELIDRFYWVFDAVYDTVHDLSDDTHALVTLLAQSAPSEWCEAFVAAGPLEDYVNEVVAKNRADLAASIVNSPALKPLLPGVWGQVKALEPLAAKYKGDSLLPDAHIDLPFTLKDIAGFWSDTCVPYFVNDYQAYFDKVLSDLKNTTDRTAMESALSDTAPDEDAREYLHIHIFSRFRH